MRIVLVRSEVTSASDAPLTSAETILCVLVSSQIRMLEKDSLRESDFKEHESSRSEAVFKQNEANLGAGKRLKAKKKESGYSYSDTGTSTYSGTGTSTYSGTGTSTYSDTGTSTYSDICTSTYSDICTSTYSDTGTYLDTGRGILGVRIATKLLMTPVRIATFKKKD